MEYSSLSEWRKKKFYKERIEKRTKRYKQRLILKDQGDRLLIVFPKKINDLSP